MSAVTDSQKEKWLQRYARLGLAAHGLVYCLMSVLTFLTSLGFSKRTADKSEAVKLIYQQPFGKVLLAVIGFSMIGYVILRSFQAFRDTRHKGKDLKGILKRFGYFMVAAGYLTLSIYCFRIAFDKPSTGDNSHRTYLVKILAFPGGQLIVGAIAIGFAIGGAEQMIRGIKKKFMKNVQLWNSDYSKTFTLMGSIGYFSRGLVFIIISYLLFRVAIEADLSQGEGTRGAFDFLRHSFGNVLLAIVSLGLLAYGLFMFVRCRHEKMSFGMQASG